MKFLRSFLRRHFAGNQWGGVAKCRLFSQASDYAVVKSGFHVSGKSQAIGDFTFCRPSQILPIFRIICPRFSRDATFICDRGIGAQQFRGFSNERNPSPMSPTYKFEFSLAGNDRRPSQKSGTHRENRNAPDSPDLSPSIPDDRGYLRFRVFIKPGFHMLGKSQTIGDFTFCRPSQILPIYQIIATGHVPETPCLCVIEYGGPEGSHMQIKNSTCKLKILPAN